MNELIFLMLVQTVCGNSAPLNDEQTVTYRECRRGVVTCIAIDNGSQRCAARKYREWLRDKQESLGEL